MTDTYNQSSTLVNSFAFVVPAPEVWVAANGGGDGLPGRNLVNGREVGSKIALELAAGDVVRIETPGGGGYGGG